MVEGHANLGYPGAAMTAWAQGLVFLAHRPWRPAPFLGRPACPPPALAAGMPLARAGRAIHGGPAHIEPWGPSRRADDGWAVIYQPAPDWLTARG